jgi:hypothetical protein
MLPEPQQICGSARLAVTRVQHRSAAPEPTIRRAPIDRRFAGAANQRFEPPGGSHRPSLESGMTRPRDANASAPALRISPDAAPQAASGAAGPGAPPGTRAPACKRGEG